MSWSTPLTWTDGLLVAAATLNTHLRDNLRYLKGQLGEIFFENALDIAETTSPANPTSGRARVWNTNTPNRQMLYARFADGTQRRLAQYAIRVRRTTNFSHPGGSWQVIPCDTVDATSHSSLALSDSTGVVIPETGLYLVSAVLYFSTPNAEYYCSVWRNGATNIIAGGGVLSAPAIPSAVSVVNLTAGDTVRIYAYASVAATITALSYTPSLSVVSL